MNHSPCIRSCGILSLAAVLMLSAGCEALHPKAASQPFLYALNGTEEAASVHGSSNASMAAPILVVDSPTAAAGFDSRRIVYIRETHLLEYFANSEWVDTPARMLPPLIVSAVVHGGVFRTALLAPTAAVGDLRLDTEIVRLQQDFGSKPSHVRFTLRATIIQDATRRVLASREFDQSVDSASEDPYGGVVAANRAVQTVVEQLAQFCNEVAARWQYPTRDSDKRDDNSVRGALYK